jgi:hypothetical protein
MRIIRSFIAPAAALAVASGIAVLPALTSASPARPQPSCTGTSLFQGLLSPPDLVRVPTLGNNSGNLNCELGLGNTGVAVRRLQIALDSSCNLFDNLAVDGIYGPLTRQAVIDVQNFYDVPADGIYGPVTATHMSWPVAGSNGNSCDFIG